MVKVIFKDGSEKDFNEANEHELNEEPLRVNLIKRHYDKEGDYNEDDDEILGTLNFDEIRAVLK